MISRLSVATATLGEVLPIVPPFANVSYQLKFYGPTVQCEDASASVAATIGSLVQKQKLASENGAVEMENFSFAFVPDLSTRANIYKSLPAAFKRLKSTIIVEFNGPL